MAVNFKFFNNTNVQSFNRTEHFLNKILPVTISTIVSDQEAKIEKRRNIIYVKCEFCEETCKTQKSLNRHQTQLHQDLLPYMCKLCTEPFLHQKDLNNHMKFHEKELIKCEHCDQTFEKLRDFEKHNVAEHYKKSDGKYECKCCQMMFTTAMELDHHLRSSNCIQRLKVWCCKLCNKTFTTKGSLGTHKKIHQGKRDFECNHCQKSFRTNSDLQRHVNRTHTKIKYFNCPVCEKKFYDRTDIMRHTSRHVKETTIYDCEICTKTFSLPQAYAAHKRKHEKKIELSHQCDYCAKSFKEIKYLKRHIQTTCRCLPKEVENALSSVEIVINEESSNFISGL